MRAITISETLANIKSDSEIEPCDSATKDLDSQNDNSPAGIFNAVNIPK